MKYFNLVIAFKCDTFESPIEKLDYATGSTYYKMTEDDRVKYSS